MKFGFWDAMASTGGIIITLLSVGMTVYVNFVFKGLSYGGYLATGSGVVFFISAIVSYIRTVRGKEKNKSANSTTIIPK